MSKENINFGLPGGMGPKVEDVNRLAIKNATDLSHEIPIEIAKFVEENRGYIKGAVLVTGLSLSSLSTMAMSGPVHVSGVDHIQSVAQTGSIEEAIRSVIQMAEENYVFVPILGVIEGTIDVIADNMRNPPEEDVGLGEVLWEIGKRSAMETGELTLFLLAADNVFNPDKPMPIRIVGAAAAALSSGYAIFPDVAGPWITKATVFIAQTAVSMGQRNQKR